MDVSVEEVRSRGLPSWFPRRRATATPEEAGLSKELAAVVAADRVAGWEWGVAIFSLFVLGRSPVLFFRQHLAGVFHGRAGPIWMSDLVLVCVFAVVQAAVIAIAIRRAHPSSLLDQPVLLGVLALVWLSTMWSIEPMVTFQRSLLFAGTAGVGWYIGDRFTMRDQMRLVAAVSGMAVLTTAVALIFWNEQARTTEGNPGQWSGVYVNRNLLGLAVSFGLLAMILLMRGMERRWLARGFVTLLILLFGLTQSRTGLFGLAAALAVAWCVDWVRKSAGHRLKAAPAAYVVFATLGTIGLIVHWYWEDILHALNRSDNLTGRTAIWEVDRWFSGQRPWQGYGFEALWTNKRAISVSFNATGRYPYTSHSGYYEMLLGVGRIGLVLFAVFLALALWRAFHHAWTRRDAVSLWPLSFIVFAIVVNFSESLFVSSEAVWAITVAAAVAVSRSERLETG